MNSAVLLEAAIEVIFVGSFVAAVGVILAATFGVL
jgi:hypothetical protein